MTKAGQLEGGKMTNGTNSKFISKPEVSFWVPIIVALVSAAMSFAVISNKVANNEKNLVKMEARVDVATQSAADQFDKTAETLLNIQVKLAEIQKDILYIKERL